MFSSTVIFWLMSSTGGLISVFIILGIFILRKAKANAAAEKKDKAPVDDIMKDKRFDSFFQLRASFAHASKFLKSRVSGRNYRYQIPWFLMLGEEDSGKSTLMENTGLGMPIGKYESQELNQEQGVQWWFYDKGIVLEPKGEFVLKHATRSSNENGWQNVIKLLKKYRPNRPIDGVILTIPASDLVWGKSKASESEWKVRMNEKFTLIYNKLWELQTELGIHFPVYILFTKCDKLGGFSSYCHEVPENLRDNIFGWSNPYTLDMSFKNAWVEEAMAHINKGVVKNQIELFAAKSEIDDHDSLFSLPSSFTTLLEPIKSILGNIFKESSFHNKFFFRGIYFTGCDLSVDEKERKPLFLRDLFERKIFVEDGLARIVDQTMLSKHRSLRITQVAFVILLIIGSGGLINTYLNLRNEKRTLLPVLSLISTSLVDLEYKKTIDRSLFEKKGLNLLNNMAKIDSSRLTSIFMPSSWTSNLQSDIVSCMTIAYEKIIMRMMYIELNNRVRTMGFAEKKYISDQNQSGVKDLRLEKTMEFEQLLSFINSLEELEKNIAIYNNQLVTGSANSREFLQVVAYLYNIDLKGSFSEEALAKLRGNPVSTDILMANVNAKIWELTRAFYDRAYTYNYLNERLINLTTILRDIHREDQSNDKQNIVTRFQNLLKLLNDIEKDLSDPAFRWMVSPSFELGNKFDQILEFVQNSGYLGRPVFVEMKNRGETEHKKLQSNMFSHQTRLTGYILQREDSKVVLRLSEKMSTLKKALEDFFAMKFADIENASSHMIDKLPPSTQMIWNTQLLSQAANLYDPYNLFLTEKLNKFPIELQPIFEQVARQSLETNMIDLIGRSQKLETMPKMANPSFRKEALRSAVLNFNESSKSISKLLGIFDRLELHATNRKLFRVVAVQGNQILKEIDIMLQEDELYMAKEGGFDWWNGQKSPVFAAYNVNDEEELKYYFATQRTRIRYLTTELAIPIISLLGYQNKHRGYVNISLVNKWERIIAAFDDLEKKKPGNSINILEDFITKEINTIASTRCIKEIPAHVISARSNDYFLNQRNKLRKKLHLRCQKLSYDREVRTF